MFTETSNGRNNGAAEIAPGTEIDPCPTSFFFEKIKVNYCSRRGYQPTFVDLVILDIYFF